MFIISSIKYSAFIPHYDYEVIMALCCEKCNIWRNNNTLIKSYLNRKYFDDTQIWDNFYLPLNFTPPRWNVSLFGEFSFLSLIQGQKTLVDLPSCFSLESRKSHSLPLSSAVVTSDSSFKLWLSSSQLPPNVLLLSPSASKWFSHILPR